MCEHRDILPAHPKVKMAGHIGSVCWSSHKEPAKPGCRIYFLQPEVFLDKILRRPLLVSVSSPVVSDVSTLCGLWDGPCFNLSSTSFNSANRETYTVPQTPKLLNPSEVKNTNFSLRETAVVLSPPHKRSDTRTPSDDQWHELQSQQERSQTDLKGKICDKNLESAWNNTSKFLV